MRDFKHEIDDGNDWGKLRDVLDELVTEIDLAYEAEFEDEAHLRHIHDLEFLLHYGEFRLETMMS
ncbi:MAG: hypothetical protein ABI700_19015 [Chloroflexota bacterium]